MEIKKYLVRELVIIRDGIPHLLHLQYLDVSYNRDSHCPVYTYRRFEKEEAGYEYADSYLIE